IVRNLFQNGAHAAKDGSCRAVLTAILLHACETDQDVGDVGMVASTGRLEDRQGVASEPFGLLMPMLVSCGDSPIMKAHRLVDRVQANSGCFLDASAARHLALSASDAASSARATISAAQRLVVITDWLPNDAALQ